MISLSEDLGWWISKLFGGFVVAMRMFTASLMVPAGAEALWSCNSANLTILSKSSITHAMLLTNPQTPVMQKMKLV
jgi:hypothetical protein